MSHAGQAAPHNPRELTPQRVRTLAVAVVILAALTVWRLVLAPVPDRGGPAEFAGQTMGTTYLVKVDHEVTDTDREQIRAAIEAALHRVDTLMSTWRADSELSALNAAPAQEPFPLASETFEVMALSQRVSSASDGAFDVTVGPLVRAWGFGAGAAAETGAPTPPPQGELEAVRTRVGFALLTLDSTARTVSKARDGIEIDLSAVAKGYAVDRVAEAIEGLGYPRFLVEVGGELAAGEPKSDGSPWRVAIETPDARTRSMFGVLELVDEGVATSGDYRNFYEVDGVKYAHLLDPRSGRPVAHSGTSVTVVHEDAAVADAWSTALSVLGPDEGYRLAVEEELTALFIWREGDDFTSRTTPPMEDRAPTTSASGGLGGES